MCLHSFSSDLYQGGSNETVDTMQCGGASFIACLHSSSSDLHQGGSNETADTMQCGPNGAV